MKRADNQVLIIFGASGDLTARKLIPAIFDLFRQDLLPKGFAVLGVSRTEINDTSFREKMAGAIKEHASLIEDIELHIADFLLKLHYLAIDTAAVDEYSKLKAKLIEIDSVENTKGNYIYYLATPPTLYSVIAQNISHHGLQSEKDAFRRIVIEKPFGEDYQSAIELNTALLNIFNENQIYRIDHYLGKETVQNLLVTRFANSIYEPLWNRNYIQHIEVTAAESIGVENRGGYYDHSGALRDMIQNHLLQLVALVAMEPPTEISAAAIRNEKLKVFQSLRPLGEDDLFKNVIRGQYVASNVRGKYNKAYRDEDGVDAQSRTETYFAMKLFIDNWRWTGVPFYVRTGKRLPTRVSEIVIHFKPAPNHLFVENDALGLADNQLILRIHPDEGILLKSGMKIPGAGYKVKSVNMDFHYKNLEETYVPGAYERLLLDCMCGDTTLYTRGDALENAWKFVQPIIDFWKNNPDAPLHGYPCGSWGPAESDELIEDKLQTWRFPCKNLSDDGIFCEL
ncbi:glucose-6-phosphate 1-dehydrogenase [Bacteroidales bacterium]|nr:glucose-6-phosphate 1-dehydrogenase [Bacteroidales bacterium]